MSAEVAFENLMTMILDAAKRAKGEGDDSAFMAYFDMLEVGISEARREGIEFVDGNLRGIDPYQLLKKDAA